MKPSSARDAGAAGFWIWFLIVVDYLGNFVSLILDRGLADGDKLFIQTT